MRGRRVDSEAIRREIERIVRDKKCVMVEELVNEVSKRLGVSKFIVAYEALMMCKNGMLEVEQTPHSVLAYVFSIESAWYWASIFIILVSSLLALLVNNPPLVYLRYIFGSILVLFMPGYSLIEALYPRGDELSPLERFALSIGLSLAVVPLIGLILNYTPWGIRFIPILTSLTTFSIALLTVALIRKARIYALGKGVCVES